MSRKLAQKIIKCSFQNRAQCLVAFCRNDGFGSLYDGPTSICSKSVFFSLLCVEASFDANSLILSRLGAEYSGRPVG
jgi:hypothetical protein